MILGIVQARLSSQRFPGKVLQPLLGKPMILRQFERIRHAQRLDRVILATSTESDDDPLEQLCKENDLYCYRGSLNDVLDRFYQAAQALHADHIVRLTGDCPLTDPDIIDQVISFYLSGDYDYASNTLKVSFPDGLDVEVFRLSVLEEAWKRATLPSDREHVTPYMYRNASRMKLGNVKAAADYSSFRWTVDEPADYEFVKAIYESLYPKKPNFSMADILSLLEQRLDFKKINQGIPRNAGYRP